MRAFSAVTSFAKQLQVPTGGDVIFRIQDTEESVQHLYAYESILSANSDYFAARKIQFLVRLTTLGLKPQWRGKDIAPDSPSQSDKRQLIDLYEDVDDIDFVTLHNILYYIYTGCVNLHYKSKDLEFPRVPEGYPAKPDPVRLYRNADKYLLPDLRDRCCNYIKVTLSIENVAENLFSAEAQRHEELQKIFLDYVLDNFDRVKDTEGYQKALCSDDVEPSLLSYRLKLMYEITKRSSQPSS